MSSPAAAPVRYHVAHRTEYRYGGRVTSGYTLAHLLPRSGNGQVVHHAEVACDPAAGHAGEHADVYGNRVSFLAVQHPHEHLVVTALSEVTVQPTPPWEPGWGAPAWDTVADALAADTTADGLLARECRLDSPLVRAAPELAAYAAPSFPPGRPIDEAVAELSGRIFREFSFDPTFSDVSTPLADVLDHRRGVCQDFAHLAIGCLRSLGLAARYVSGYLETEPPPGQPKLVGADASHAWCGVFVPGQGWFDIDPTNDLVSPGLHVTVAWGRDFGDVAPVRGVVFGPATTQELTVAVDVVRLDP